MNVGGDVRRSRRRAADRRGRWAEFLAAAILSTRGYRIVARRWRTPVGEIDLVARKRGVVAFIEVKTRGNAEALNEVVTMRQRRRIARAAAAFLAARADLNGCDARFDVMLVAPWRWPLHIENAWRADA